MRKTGAVCLDFPLLSFVYLLVDYSKPREMTCIIQRETELFCQPVGICETLSGSELVGHMRRRMVITYLWCRVSRRSSWNQRDMCYMVETFCDHLPKMCVARSFSVHQGSGGIKTMQRLKWLSYTYGLNIHLSFNHNSFLTCLLLGKRMVFLLWWKPQLELFNMLH